MNAEFDNLGTSDARKIEEFVYRVEESPLWCTVLLVRESAARIIYLRGRLFGMKQEDLIDIFFDLNSCRDLGLEEEEITASLKCLIALECAYYGYAEKRARITAFTSGNSDSTEDMADIARDTVARVLWFTWKPQGIEKNGLHRSVLKTLKFLGQHSFRQFMFARPFSQFEDYLIEQAETVVWTTTVTVGERPIKEIRDKLRHLSLEEIFAALEKVPHRERLAILCVMGYLESASNFTQASK